MPNYIFFDTETNSGRQFADILSINALFCSEDFKIISELNCEARLRKSRIYEVDSFLVNGFDPFKVDKHPLSKTLCLLFKDRHPLPNPLFFDATFKSTFKSTFRDTPLSKTLSNPLSETLPLSNPL